MVRASGYVLLVGPERAETLLDHAAPGQSVGEPVPQFAFGVRAPLLILASFARGSITHIADGRKGLASGTRMVRLNLSDLQELAAPISISRLVEALPPRFQRRVARRFEQGGLIAPAGFQAVIDALRTLAPDTAGRVTRFSDRRSRALDQMSDRALDALAQQKESVGLALKIAGFDTRELLAWSPPADVQPSSFLDGLPGARVREDAMVAHDLGVVPGFDAVRDYPFAAKIFEREGTRLTVILANKLPLEQQFGTDLIYFNETYQALVMVQYKAMERSGTARPQFRLPNAQLDIEIDRMDATTETLADIPDDESRDGFRLNTSPFFLKLCARHVFNPDDGGLFPGMYIPINYWRRLVADPATLGPKGGRVVTFENVGRKLTESEFIPLVAGGWVGTHAPQSQILAQLVRDIIETGKAVTLAVRTGKGSPSTRRR